MIEVPMPSATAISLYGSHVDHGVHGLGGHRRDHVVDVHAHFLEVALLEAGAGVITSMNTLPTDEPVWFATLSPLSSLTLVRLRSLRVTICAVLPTYSIWAIATRPPLSWPMMNDCAGVGAHVHLPRDHLLHGEIARRDGELLELDAVLLEQTRLEQIVGRHPPDVGLEALADGVERECRSRAAEARRHQAGARREILPSCQVNAPVPHRMFLRDVVAIGVARRFVSIDRVSSCRRMSSYPKSLQLFGIMLIPAAGRIRGCWSRPRPASA